MSPTCPFCDFDQPEVTVYADTEVRAFVSLAPINRYHVLVVPKAHYVHFVDIPHGILTTVMKVAQQMSRAIGAVARPDAISLLTDDDLTHSGFNRVAHRKLHVIPRYRNDAVVIDWHREPDPGIEARTRYSDEIRRVLLVAGAIGKADA